MLSVSLALSLSSNVHRSFSFTTATRARTTCASTIPPRRNRAPGRRCQTGESTVPGPAAPNGISDRGPVRPTGDGRRVSDRTSVVWTVGHSTHSLDALRGVAGRARDRAGGGHPSRAEVSPYPATSMPTRWRGSLPERGLALRASAAPRRLAAGARGLSERRLAKPVVSRVRRLCDDVRSSRIGLAQLRGIAAAGRTVVMCSEALWWRCHRRLVADRLLVAGATVCHIGSSGRVSAHRLTPFAIGRARPHRSHTPTPSASRSAAVTSAETRPLSAERGEAVAILAAGGAAFEVGSHARRPRRRRRGRRARVRRSGRAGRSTGRT